MPSPTVYVCPQCDREIQPGEHIHPTVQPFHVPCALHHQCYVLCDHFVSVLNHEQGGVGDLPRLVAEKLQELREMHLHSLEPYIYDDTDMTKAEFDALLEEAEPIEIFYRADGNMVCSCGKTYSQHPLDGPDGYDGFKFLRRLCNGDLIKT